MSSKSICCPRSVAAAPFAILLSDLIFGMIVMVLFMLPIISVAGAVKKSKLLPGPNRRPAITAVTFVLAAVLGFNGCSKPTDPDPTRLQIIEKVFDNLQDVETPDDSPYQKALAWRDNTTQDTLLTVLANYLFNELKPLNARRWTARLLGDSYIVNPDTNINNGRYNYVMSIEIPVSHKQNIYLLPPDSAELVIEQAYRGMSILLPKQPEMFDKIMSLLNHDRALYRHTIALLLGGHCEENYLYGLIENEEDKEKLIQKLDSLTIGEFELVGVVRDAARAALEYINAGGDGSDLFPIFQ